MGSKTPEKAKAGKDEMKMKWLRLSIIPHGHIRKTRRMGRQTTARRLARMIIHEHLTNNNFVLQ